MAFKSKKKNRKAQDLGLLPFMNLFSILIPFLLSVAVFEKMGILELNLPERSPPDKNKPKKNPEKGLNLTIIVTDEMVTLGGSGGFTAAAFYQEVVDWRSKSDKTTFTKAWNPEEKVISPTDGKEMTPYEKETIHLYYVDKKDEKDPGTPKEVAVNSLGEPLVDSTGNFIENRKVAVGETYRLIGSSNFRTATAREINQFNISKLSVYDHVARDLWTFKTQIDAMEEPPDDANKITILAGEKIIYDKIIHLMDAAKYAGFTNISLSLLGG